MPAPGTGRDSGGCPWRWSSSARRHPAWRKLGRAKPAERGTLLSWRGAYGARLAATNEFAEGRHEPDGGTDGQRPHGWQGEEGLVPELRPSGAAGALHQAAAVDARRDRLARRPLRGEGPRSAAARLRCAERAALRWA